jgi:hypothetical protein
MRLSYKHKILIYVLIGISVLGLILYLFLPKPNILCKWVSSDWSECVSETEQRTVTCKTPDGSICDKCVDSGKPNTTQKCTPKPPSDTCDWKVGEWSECVNRNQTRNVICQTPEGSNCDKCVKNKPSDKQNCNVKQFCCDLVNNKCVANTNGCGTGTPINDCQNCKQTGWPSNVYFFSTDDNRDVIQSRINNVFKTQGGNTPENNGQFSLDNYALLFSPGIYNNIDIPIGYYTHVAGLGSDMSGVKINGMGPHVDNSSTNPNVGSLNNFWRSCENMTVIKPSDEGTNEGTMIWSVSQAASLRSMDIKGDLQLFAVEQDVGGFASGGFIANIKTNNIINGSQQQFIVRNCSFDSFIAPLWNQVLVGCDLANPISECCIKEGKSGSTTSSTLTIEELTPEIAEKPYLVETTPGVQYILSIIKPAIKTVSYGYSGSPISSVKVNQDDYYRATPKDTSAVIQAQLDSHKDIIFCPGIYNLDETIILSGQLLFGLGIPRLISSKGKDIVKGYGDICGIIFEAGQGSVNKTVLVNMNSKTRSNLWDVYCRVGGGLDESVNYSADKMIYVAGDNSILDNCWCWVADHYASNKYTGWAKASCDTGVHIVGDSVKCYGMFAEHNHNLNLRWSGNNGEMYMFQSEFNYFPPNKNLFENIVSYQVDNNHAKLKKHKIRGAGAYCFFACSIDDSTDIYALAGFRFPDGVVDYKTVFTVYLNGYGGIDNVIVNEQNVGDGQKVQRIGNGKNVTNPKCNPPDGRPLGPTMLSYRCSSDTNANDFCGCLNCNLPSTCKNGDCVPEFGCDREQINSVCGGCNCGQKDKWKCIANPSGCFPTQEAANIYCNRPPDDKTSSCTWW